MLNSDFLVVDIEGFRHKSQQFIPKEISVRGANYQDTKGIVWEAGSYDHIHFQFLQRAQN